MAYEGAYVVCGVDVWCTVPYRVVMPIAPEVAVASTPSWRVIASDIAVVLAAVGSLVLPLAVLTYDPGSAAPAAPTGALPTRWVHQSEQPTGPAGIPETSNVSDFGRRSGASVEAGPIVVTNVFE